MSQDDLPDWVDLSDNSGFIRVRVNQLGVPRVEFGLGTKSALEHMEWVSQTQLLLNRALGEYTTVALAHRRERSAARRAEQREGTGTKLTAEQRLDNLLVRTVETQRQAREFRSQGRDLEPVTAGSKNRVYVEARNGFVTLLTVDEQCYASTPVESLADEINEALAAVVTTTGQASGPLMGINHQSRGV